LRDLSDIALDQGDVSQAFVLLIESLTLALEPWDKHRIAQALEGLARVAAANGNIARAGRLWGAADLLAETIEVPLMQQQKSLHDRYVDLARGQDNATILEDAWAEGRTMTLEETVQFALSQASTSGSRR
jgi:hypothetical protein